LAVFGAMNGRERLAALEAIRVLPRVDQAILAQFYAAMPAAEQDALRQAIHTNNVDATGAHQNDFFAGADRGTVGDYVVANALNHALVGNAIAAMLRA